MRKNTIIDFSEESKKIFSNEFSLIFNNEIIEESYEQNIISNKKIIIVFLVLQTIFLIPGLILLFQFEIDKSISYNLFIEYYGFLCCSFLTVSYLFFFLQLKFSKLSRFFLYFNFISIQIIAIFFFEYSKFYLNLSFPNYEKMLFTVTFEIVICYILFCDNCFLRVLTSLLSNFIIYAIFYYTLELHDITRSLIDLGCSLFLRLVIYYIWCRFSKETFYYKDKIEVQINWIYDILNNWNSGVIVYNLNRHRVTFSNAYFEKFTEFQEKKQASPIVNENNELNVIQTNQINIISNPVQEENIPKINSDNSTIGNNTCLTQNEYGYMDNIINKNNIFKHLFDINTIIPEEIRNAFLTSNFSDIIDIINNYFPNEADNIFFTEFIFLGHVFLNFEHNRVIFELSLHGFTSTKGIFYEIMINDVSKTKLMEEERIKDKTMLLGKISHEFKNPLIVVDEVIDQIIENDDNKNHTNKACLENLRKLRFVKNLCNYMLILVKDFEVVASLENSIEIAPCIDSLEIKPFLTEIGQIIETLIDKKEALNLNFQLSIEAGLYKIETDPVRLKQILVNLLSNSVKFTETGVIELKVEIIKQEESNKNQAISTVSGIISELNLQQDYEFKNNQVADIEMEKFSGQIEKQTIIKKPIIRFSVNDTGKGISDNLINLINSEKNVKVFQKDQSAINKLGTGYGLNIVQRLCKVLNSNLFARRGQTSSGSMFYFDLPQEEIDLIYEEEYDKVPINTISNYNIVDSVVLRKKPVSKVQKSNYYNKDDKLIFDKYPTRDSLNRFFIRKHFSEENHFFSQLSGINEYNIKMKNNSQSQIQVQNNCFESCNEQKLFTTKKLIYNIKLPKTFFVENEIKNYDNDNLRIEDQAQINLENPSNSSSDKEKSEDEIVPKMSKRLASTKRTSFEEFKTCNSKVPKSINLISNDTIKKPEESHLNKIETQKYTNSTNNKLPSNEINEFKLKIFNFEINKSDTLENSRKLIFIIVDDETFIRSAIVRVITSELKNSNESLDLTIVEACDGIECLLAIYLYNKKNIKIDAIISDETMPYISGSFLSKIINNLVVNSSIPEINMFISTGLDETIIKSNYSDSVKKIFPKPINKHIVKEILALV